MKSRLRVSWVLGIILPSFAVGGAITVPSGGQFIASANACLNIGGFYCPPHALMLGGLTQPTAVPVGYTLVACVTSLATRTSNTIRENFPLCGMGGGLARGAF